MRTTRQRIKLAFMMRIACRAAPAERARRLLRAPLSHPCKASRSPWGEAASREAAVAAVRRPHSVSRRVGIRSKQHTERSSAGSASRWRVAIASPREPPHLCRTARTESLQESAGRSGSTPSAA
eukprot:scaffold129_cov254-Pinguiococcus_pyrenoidosus.AAC.17